MFKLFGDEKFYLYTLSNNGVKIETKVKIRVVEFNGVSALPDTESSYIHQIGTKFCFLRRFVAGKIKNHMLE